MLELARLSLYVAATYDDSDADINVDIDHDACDDVVNEWLKHAPTTGPVTDEKTRQMIDSVADRLPYVYCAGCQGCLKNEARKGGPNFTKCPHCGADV